MQVVDYSAGFPGAAAIKNAGYAGAVRYVGFPDRRKCTNAAEVRDFTAHGLGMAIVFEDTLTTWRGSRPAGRVSANTARRHATSVGLPIGQSIYFAIDQDVVTLGEFDTMVEYLRGCGDALGGHNLVGVYGEADVIDRARDAGVARFFWQTAAWSRGRRASNLHLLQHVGTVHVGGVACDANDVLADNWGQHTFNSLTEDDMLTQNDGNVLFRAVDPEVPEHAETLPLASWVSIPAYRTARIQTDVKTILALMSELVANGVAGLSGDDVLARIDNAVREATTTAMINTVLPALKGVLHEALGEDNDEQADAIVLALSKKLAA